MGKVSVIKTFAVPKLIHVLTALPAPPAHILKQLESVLKHFFFLDNKRAKLSWDKLSKPKEEGGLNLTNIDKLNKSLTIKWVHRFLTNDGRQG